MRCCWYTHTRRWWCHMVSHVDGTCKSYTSFVNRWSDVGLKSYAKLFQILQPRGHHGIRQPAPGNVHVGALGQHERPDLPADRRRRRQIRRARPPTPRLPTQQPHEVPRRSPASPLQVPRLVRANTLRVVPAPARHNRREGIGAELHGPRDRAMRLRVRQRRVRRGRKHLLEHVRVDSFSDVAGGRESNASLRVVPT